jgi:hypothetical protein
VILHASGSINTFEFDKGFYDSPWIRRVSIPMNPEYSRDTTHAYPKKKTLVVDQYSMVF